ncbi:putative E3 ubiquitin ligase PUB14 [Corchorus olitorius]|uniref:E3 ubiquitin ligase PUB14 n=1 Tax=Corchorus olitorius TaxID=93759 RepID=A0A1R3J1P1_9ROSI|nr:putative E3 ubiquitin ligase PUB14 [Corchorus olitorius]
MRLWLNTSRRSMRLWLSTSHAGRLARWGSPRGYPPIIEEGKAMSVNISFSASRGTCSCRYICRRWVVVICLGSKPSSWAGPSIMKGCRLYTVPGKKQGEIMRSGGLLVNQVANAMTLRAFVQREEMNFRGYPPIVEEGKTLSLPSFRSRTAVKDGILGGDGGVISTGFASEKLDLKMMIEELECMAPWRCQWFSYVPNFKSMVFICAQFQVHGFHMYPKKLMTRLEASPSECCQ